MKLPQECFAGNNGVEASGRCDVVSRKEAERENEGAVARIL